MTRATFEKVGAPPCLQSVLSFPLLEGIGWIQLPTGPGPLWILGDGKTGISQHCINILHLRSDCWVLEPRMFIPCLSSMQCILHTCLIRRVTNGEAGLSTVISLRDSTQAGLFKDAKNVVSHAPSESTAHKYRPIPTDHFAQCQWRGIGYSNNILI